MRIPAPYPFILKYAGELLFLFFLCIGLFTYDVYGISWDEDVQREIGLVSWNYIVHHDQTLLNYPLRDYGVGFELVLIALEKALCLSDDSSIYLIRHLASHVFFLIGAYYFYKLIDLLYSTKGLAVLGFLLFVLHPLIYTHSFFNSKDVPFLSVLSICFYVSAKALLSKRSSMFIVLGIGMGLLINIRIMGSLLLLSVLFLLAIDAFRSKQIRLHLKLASLLIVFSVLVLFMSWPYLWNDPLANYVTAFKNMARFRWPHLNLFQGHLVAAADLPWYYIPVWFGISTPLVYLFIGISGIGLFSVKLFSSTTEVRAGFLKRFQFIFLICFFVPVVMVISLHSVLYDGWRHVYFIYPSFCMMIVYAVSVLGKQLKTLAMALLLGSMLWVTVHMIRYFPAQHVYFNSLVSMHAEPEYIRKQYDMDYWGTSFKQGIEYILENDPSDSLAVYVEQYPASNLYILLSPGQRKRVHFVNETDARYFMTNYRWHPHDYPFQHKKVYSLRVLNTSVIDVFKLN